MKEKKEIEKRCPWCGETYSCSTCSTPRDKIIYCEKCKRYGCRVLGRLRLIFILFNLMALASLLYMFIQFERIGFEWIIFICIFCYFRDKSFVYFDSEPYERYSTGKWNKYLYSYPFPKAAAADITWESFDITRIANLKWKVVEKSVLQCAL